MLLLDPSGLLCILEVQHSESHVIELTITVLSVVLIIVFVWIRQAVGDS